MEPMEPMSSVGRSEKPDSRGWANPSIANKIAAVGALIALVGVVVEGTQAFIANAARLKQEQGAPKLTLPESPDPKVGSPPAPLAPPLPVMAPSPPPGPGRPTPAVDKEVFETREDFPVFVVEHSGSQLRRLAVRLPRFSKKIKIVGRAEPAQTARPTSPIRFPNIPSDAMKSQLANAVIDCAVAVLVTGRAEAECRSSMKVHDFFLSRLKQNVEQVRWKPALSRQGEPVEHGLIVRFIL